MCTFWEEELNKNQMKLQRDKSESVFRMREERRMIYFFKAYRIPHKKSQIQNK